MRKPAVNHIMILALTLCVGALLLALPCPVPAAASEQRVEATLPQAVIDLKIEFDSASFVNAWLKKHYTGPCVRLLKQTSYDEEGVPQNYYAFRYNKLNGRLVKDLYYSRTLVWMKFDSYHTYVYNPSGTLVKKKKFDPNDVLLESYVYSYNPSGLLTKIQTYSSSGKRGDYDVYQYNAERDVAKITRRESNGDLKYYMLVTYDSKKRARKVQMYYPRNLYVGYANIYYDSEGKPIKVTAYYSNDSPYRKAFLKYQLCP